MPAVRICRNGASARGSGVAGIFDQRRLGTWLTPGALVDLRQGGEWTAHFPGGKTGGGTIVSFIPQDEMVISAIAPERFPTVRSERTTVRFRFEAKGDSTIVRLTQTGWNTCPEWGKAYEYLTVGNASCSPLCVSDSSTGR